MFFFFKKMNLLFQPAWYLALGPELEGKWWSRNVFLDSVVSKWLLFPNRGGPSAKLSSFVKLASLLSWHPWLDLSTRKCICGINNDPFIEHSPCAKTHPQVPYLTVPCRPIPFKPPEVSICIPDGDLPPLRNPMLRERLNHLPEVTEVVSG